MTESSKFSTATTPAPPLNGNGDNGADSSMKDKATDAAGTAKQAGSDVASTAADKAKDVAAETKRQARDLLSETREQVTSRVGGQHENLVKNVRQLGDELSGMASSTDQSGVATELVAQAGERAHGVADWLDSRAPAELLDDVRSFARQRPAVFLVGALVAGVAVGRLTRGVVAAHKDGQQDDSTNAPDPSTVSTQATGYTPTAATEYSPTTATEYSPTTATEYIPTNATGYSSPPLGETSPGFGAGR
jgi:hypothetical protein